MIKIKLASPTANISKYINGLYRGFLCNGVDASIWIMENKPAFDLFYEEQFDVLFIEEENLKNNRALLKCLKEKWKSLLLIMKVKDNTPHSSYDWDLPLEIANKTLVIATDESCKEKAGTAGNWIVNRVRYGVNFDHYYVKKEEIHTSLHDRSGIVYIGRPSKIVNSILSNLCNPIGKFNIRLFTPATASSDEVFPFAQFCGQLNSLEKERNVYVGAETGLDIVESGQNFISEKVYEMAACDTEIITNNKLVENIFELNVHPRHSFDLDGFYKVGFQDDMDFSLFSYNHRAKEILELL